MTAYAIDTTPQHLICDPRNPEFFNNPYALYAALAESMPIAFWQDYGHWCVFDWVGVNALLRDKRFGRQILHVATRQEMNWPEPPSHLADFNALEAHSLLELEPPEHTRLRTLVNRAFVSRQVEQLRPRIETLAHELIDQFEQQDSTDLIASFATPIPVMIISEMLGVPKEMAPQLLDWSHRMVRMFAYGKTHESEVDANTASAEFAAYLLQLAQEKRKKPGQDLITYMIETEHRGQKLTDAELISTAILLLNAGHEATVHQTGNGVKAILESGLDPKNLFVTASEGAKTVEECLRFDAPLHMFMRFALCDVELENGIMLKKGDKIGLNFGAANRDPKRFTAANKFDPNREDQGNVSFGAGIHFCIGAPLARLELQVSLKVLFDRLPHLKLASPPICSNNYHFHSLEKLHVSWR